VSAGRILRRAGTVLFALLVVSLLVGAVLGQPVLLGYVTSDSMEPTLEPGDGFVAVPSFVAGEPEPGDVVVFQARDLNDGGLTTHRVVEVTDEGYVTKGDANPFTDQDGGEPPVSDGQVVAHAVQVGGSVVAIPYLGTAVDAVRTAVTAPFDGVDSGRAGTYMVIAGIVLFLLAGATGDRARRDASRERGRRSVVSARVVAVAAVIVVVAAATAAMALPAGVHEVTVVSTERPGESPALVAAGGSTEIDFEFHNGGLLPVLVVLEPASSGTAVDPDRAVLGRGERVNATLTASVPDETGVYARHVRESRYILVLPPAVVGTLHAVHPLVALLAVDLVVAAFVLAVAVGVFGTGQLRLRSGPGDTAVGRKIERTLKRWR